MRSTAASSTADTPPVTRGCSRRPIGAERAASALSLAAATAATTFPAGSGGYQTGHGINASSEITLKIGAEAVPGHGRYFTGLIDEVMLFDVDLNDERIQRLHRGER